MWKKIRSTLGVILPAVIALLCIAVVVVTFVIVRNDRMELIRTNQALIEQVKSTGEVPVVDSPSEVVRGEVGSPGATGASGPRGEKGERGERGLIGLPGQAGPKGDKGDTGAASTIPGPAGSPGANGKDSTTPGPAGSDGADGAAGSPGATGAQGAQGADSTVPGPTGPAGADGLNGADGRSVGSISCMMGSDLLNTYFVFYDTAGAEISRVAGSCVPG